MMTWRIALSTLLMLVIAGAAHQNSQAQTAGLEQDIDPEAEVEDVEHTSFVWLKRGITAETIEKQLIDRKIEVIAKYDQLNGFAVRMNASQLQALVDRFPEDFEGVDYVEPDGIVSLFTSGCSAAGSLPTTQTTPMGVTRVGGPMILPAGFGGSVWVIDSGIALEYDQTSGDELFVDRTRSVYCKASSCSGVDPDDTDDSLGHGTAIAGVIGAKDNGKWLVGVAPGATLVAVKAFKKDSDKTNWAVLYQAVLYVVTHAAPGDVVNISWGSTWNPDPNGKQRQMENLIRLSADAGVRFAIAAGNLDELDDSAYIHTVSPARAAAYPKSLPTANDGAVMAASAVDATDHFWPESGFGNGATTTTGGNDVGPPDVAEPGVEIETLGLGNTMTRCTGTSFAAAHLAGILLQGIPAHDGRAIDDVDSVYPETGPDPTKNDPIGVCVPDAGGNCQIPP